MSIVDRLRWLLLNGFGLGLVPVAPGTFGTLTGVVIGAILCALLDGAALTWTLGGLAAGLLAFGVTQTAFAERVFPGDDPQQIVLDEVIGYLAALALFAGLAGHPTPVVQAAAFVAFRAFDVLKVPPANRLEELPGMPGVMLDDVAAGVWTGAALLAGRALGFL
jgi:phosphatidylglycerophosphatase A